MHGTNQIDSEYITGTNSTLTPHTDDVSHRHEGSVLPSSTSASHSRRLSSVAEAQEFDPGRLQPEQTTALFHPDGSVVTDRLSTSVLLRILHARVRGGQHDLSDTDDIDEDVRGPPSYTSGPAPRV